MTGIEEANGQGDMPAFPMPVEGSMGMPEVVQQFPPLELIAGKPIKSRKLPKNPRSPIAKAEVQVARDYHGHFAKEDGFTVEDVYEMLCADPLSSSDRSDVLVAVYPPDDSGERQFVGTLRLTYARQPQEVRKVSAIDVVTGYTSSTTVFSGIGMIDDELAVDSDEGNGTEDFGRRSPPILEFTEIMGVSEGWEEWARKRGVSLDEMVEIGRFAVAEKDKRPPARKVLKFLTEEAMDEAEGRGFKAMIAIMPAGILKMYADEGLEPEIITDAFILDTPEVNDLKEKFPGYWKKLNPQVCLWSLRNLRISQRISLGVSQEYVELMETVSEQSVEDPEVNMYDLATPEGWIGFEGALGEFQWQTSHPETESIFHRAIKDRVYIDPYKDQWLVDMWKLDAPSGLTPEEHQIGLSDYQRENNKWENTVIVERSWVEGSGRFVRIPKKEDFDRVIRSRNKFIIDPETQRKLQEVTIGIAGMGVGSAVAYLLALTGVERFVVADGGTLNPHNFNRSLLSDVGATRDNLALLWKQKVLDVYPFATITAIAQNLGQSGQPDAYPLAAFLEQADVVFEEMDNLPMKIVLREEAKRKGKPVLMVSDLARGGHIQYETVNPEDTIFGGRLTDEKRAIIFDPNTDRKTRTQLVTDIFVGGASSELLLPLQNAFNADLPYWPQGGQAAWVNAALGVETIIRLLEGKDVPTEMSFQFYTG